MAAELPYDESPYPGWAEQFDSWRWQATETSSGKIVGWSKQGPCPRCHHTTPISLGLTVGFVAAATSQVYAQCECSVQHAASKTGCGAAGMIEGPRDE